MHEWTPDQVIDAGVAADVVARQFPHLAGLPVRPFDAGWDNVLMAVGDAWLLRFVHRDVALPGARRELAVLRHLADRFSVAVPHPELVGTPTPELPRPFWGTRRLPGVELARAHLPDGARGPLASAVGRFLGELHDPALARETAAAAEGAGAALPLDPMSRSDAAVTAGRARDALEHLVRDGLWEPSDDVVALLGEADGLGRPDDSTAVLVHGDLHVRHLLVHDATAGGVIDWGDTALADPAVDLMIAYMAFEGRAREALLGAYGRDVPPERELRARTLAVRVAAVLARYAAVEGLTEVHHEALAGLRRAVR